MMFDINRERQFEEEKEDAEVTDDMTFRINDIPYLLRVSLKRKQYSESDGFSVVIVSKTELNVDMTESVQQLRLSAPFATR